ncbi:hypothetical protein CJ030_MR3G007104 [Morella rubra]|uniref:Disease resistance R13L4/SHOC-2-like LRR domain-containing protein n=1 Tax=Morella rubra TaxID=262757 RepID=A0A6A1W591_9ROSI|nr:hypothetical protein CJ030_MR3G007104 [Morella rubra]
MHDVARDVAISIASRDEHGFKVVFDNEIEEWPEEDTYESYAAISLGLRELDKNPEKFLDDLFSGMKELKALSLECISFHSLPPSIRVLENLRMLNLADCSLEDVTTIGSLGTLEILSFRDSSIRELPKDIGNLARLKLLDLLDCDELERIAGSVLSSLTRLEELYVGESFMNRESTEGNGEGRNARLEELIPQSPQMMALDIVVARLRLLPKDLRFNRQKLKFNFTIGSLLEERHKRNRGYLLENRLQLGCCSAVDIRESPMLHLMLEKSTDLVLVEIQNLKNILHELDGEGFPCLKILEVRASDDLEYVIDGTSDQS